MGPPILKNLIWNKNIQKSQRDIHLEKQEEEVEELVQKEVEELVQEEVEDVVQREL